MPRPLRSLLVAGFAGLALGLAACGGSDSPIRPSPPGGGPEPPPSAVPTVTGIAPAAGASAGGTAVTITGTNFAAGATVTFAGTAATEVSVVNATTLTAKTPARSIAANKVDVAVTVNGRTVSLTEGFSYINVSPQVTDNLPPVIARIRARGTRPGIPFNFADLGETINIVAEVQDADTPIDQLAYQWRVTGGTIIGNGSSVQWRAPDNGVRGYDLELEVTERYSTTTPGGVVETKEHHVKSTVQVSVHDSVREIREMARTFLLEFSLQRPVDTVLRDFTVSPGCPRGRSKEKDDVEQNHRENVIKEYFIGGDPEITVNFAGVCRFARELGDACAYVPVKWNSLYMNTEMRIAEGIDQVTAMYEGNRWWLCDSHFIPKGTNGTVRSWFKR